MKRIVLIYIFLFSFVQILPAQNISIEGLRKDYGKVRKDSVSCAKVYAKVKKSSSQDNTINAYKGAIIASMANYSKVKEEKIGLFKEGKQLLEKAIASDNNNVELRFLRMTIQTNCPKALGYNKEIENDKKLILSKLSSIKDPGLKNMMSEFLLDSKFVSEKEKSELKG